MVAVVTGSGLGLDNGSLRQLGLGLGGQASIGQGSAASYLNAATGNVVLESADEGLIFDGLRLDALRTYNSQGQWSGNAGWQFGFSRSVGGLSGTLDTAGSTITRTGDDGSAVVYAYDASVGQYVSSGQSGAADTLTWSAASSSWTWADAASSQQETYNAGGQLTGLSDTQTGASYSFGYSGSQLIQITAGDGDALAFTYNASGQLTGLTIQEVPPGQATAVTRQQVSYGYDASGRLQTVTTLLASDTDGDPGSYTTTYGYDGSSDRVASVTQSDGTTVSYSYTEDAQGVYQVTGITTGTGADAQSLDVSYGPGSTTLTNALGQATTYTYNAAGELTEVTAPSVDGVAPTTQYAYDANGNLLSATDADGGVTRYSYDGSGNLLSVEDATGHTVSYTYNGADQVLSQTVYTVAAQGVAGQDGYVAPSGAQTTYYVYDAGQRLAYVVDPLGHVTEHDYAASGGLTVLGSTRQYLGASMDLTDLSPATPPSLASVQAWVASSPVQSTLAQSTRTDYSYDVRGQLATQTQWDTVDSSGAGVLDAATAITTYTYDAYGELLQSATERGGDRATRETTSYAYDGLGRLVSRTDPLGQATSYVYTDSANTLAITQANGLTTTQVRNSAGLLVSSTQSASGQTSRVTGYLYNALGQNVAVIEPAGNVSYTFYDADGRVSGTVDATGAVTAYSDDADGHVIGSTRYATLVDTSGWVSGGALSASMPTSLPVPAGTAGDITTYTLVDAAGRVIATIDGAGNVTTTAYDGEGHAIGHTAYATALTVPLGSAPTWATLQNELAANASASDRTTYTLYDAAGRAAATIDAAGYATVTTYDDAGRAIKTTASAVALAAGVATLGNPPTLAALTAALTPNVGDQTTRTTYDGEGRVVAQVDADGYLTTTAYDETTHTATTTRYATWLTSGQLTALTGSESVATLVGLLGSSTANEQSSTTYNADGQVASATAVDGSVTTYSYNTVGQLLGTTVTPAAGQGNVRTTGATYDAFGDTLTRVDGNQATTTYTYNVLGQRITATDPVGNTTWTYDDADGRVRYSVQGQPSGGTLNARGNVTAYQYNAFGQVTGTRQYASALILTGGTSSGITLNPATATLAQVASAVAALPLQAGDADGRTSYTYTLDGQVASTTNGDNYQTAYAYDAFGDRIQVQQQLSGAGTALSAANSTISTFASDNRGEQVGQTDAVGSAVARSTSQTYDAFGRLLTTTDALGNVSTNQYDGDGDLIQSTDATGHIVTYRFDASGRVLTRTVDPTGLNLTTSYAYDGQGRTLSVTDPTGVVTT